MKFIGFYEYRPEDIDKCIAKLKEAMAERERGSEAKPKIIFGPYTMGGERGMLKGFAGYETDDQSKLDHLVAYYLPEMTFNFTPIQDQSKMAEVWIKMKK